MSEKKTYLVTFNVEYKFIGADSWEHYNKQINSTITCEPTEVSREIEREKNSVYGILYDKARESKNDCPCGITFVQIVPL